MAAAAARRQARLPPEVNRQVSKLKSGQLCRALSPACSIFAASQVQLIAFCIACSSYTCKCGCWYPSCGGRSLDSRRTSFLSTLPHAYLQKYSTQSMEFSNLCMLLHASSVTRHPSVRALLMYCRVIYVRNLPFSISSEEVRWSWDKQ